MKSKRDVLAEKERVQRDISEADTNIQALREQLDTVGQVDADEDYDSFKAQAKELPSKKKAIQDDIESELALKDSLQSRLNELDSMLDGHKLRAECRSWKRDARVLYQKVHSYNKRILEAHRLTEEIDSISSQMGISRDHYKPGARF